MAATEERYQPGTHPSLPPPITAAGPIGWLRANLFSSPLNILLTLLSIALLIYIVPPLIQWAFLDATWTGVVRDSCNDAQGTDLPGACWPIVPACGARI